MERTAFTGRLPNLPSVPRVLWMPPDEVCGEAAISDVGGGPRLPFYSGGKSHREHRARAQSSRGPASSERKKHNRSKQVLFLYLKKSFGGWGVV